MEEFKKTYKHAIETKEVHSFINNFKLAWKESDVEYCISDDDERRINFLICSIYEAEAKITNRISKLILTNDISGTSSLIKCLCQVAGMLSDSLVISHVNCSKDYITKLKTPLDLLRESYGKHIDNLCDYKQSYIRSFIKTLHENKKTPFIIIENIEHIYVKAVDNRSSQVQKKSREFIGQLHAIGDTEGALGWLVGNHAARNLVYQKEFDGSSLLGKYIGRYPSLNDTKYSVCRL